MDLFVEGDNSTILTPQELEKIEINLPDEKVVLLNGSPPPKIECPNTPYLLKENYLSEYITEELKQKVRDNLNIGLADSLEWGNITGDINNLKDLAEALSNKASGNVGIPIYDDFMLDSLGESKPDKYIIIPDGIEGSIENKTHTTQNNGLYIDILFSAIRSLQAEVSRLKNTFAYGICSYNDEHTTSSNVVNSTEEEEKEALWAMDPEDLSEITELTVPINSECTLLPRTSFVVEDGFISVQKACYIDTLNTLLDYDESRLFSYIQIDPKDNWTCTIELDNNLLINIHNIIGKLKCNVLFMISRQFYSDDDELLGKNFLWMSITDRHNDVIIDGYLKNNVIYNNEQLLQDRLCIKRIKLNKVDLYKLSFYTKHMSFSSDSTLPSQPVTDDFILGAAHLTIRSVKNKTILERVKNRLLNNEFIWVEEDEKLYIKSQHKLFSISGGVSDDETEEGMTQEEMIEWLTSNNLIEVSTDGYIINSAKLSPISDITFIHEGSQNTYNIKIDSEGNLVSVPVSSVEEDPGVDPDLIVPDGLILGRGAAANYNLNILYNRESGSFDSDGAYTINATALSNIITSDGESLAFAKGDRVRISSWYTPVLNLTTFNCSHDFIEITNCGTDDYPLDNAVIGLLKKYGTVYTMDTFNLQGVIKAESTYLIRAKQHIDINSPLAHVAVKDYDIELWSNRNLYSLEGVEGMILYHNRMPEINVNSESGNLTRMKNNTDNSYFIYSVNPNLIDIVFLSSDIVNYFVDNNSNLWAEQAYSLKENSIIKDQYFLDPAKQAFRSLSSTSETSNCRLQKVLCEVIPLGNKYIEFPHSDVKKDVADYTPRASKYHKHVCTDKTQVDQHRPNMVLCSFGIDAQLTRCFNWFSVGYRDEFVWIREKGTESWAHKFESYKDGDGDKVTSADSYPTRKEFSLVIIDSVYKRMTGVFPAEGSLYTAHKVIVQITDTPLNKTYEYIVGRLDKNGNPDLEHASNVQEFTLHTNTYTPFVVQTTDQQGFGWLEYLVWSAAAVEILNKIEEECSQGYNKFPVYINTGDMTQNGTRINEWLDYYYGGYEIFKKYEHAAVIGNNDLCNSYGPQFLGTGDDMGKSSPYYFHMLFCHEIPNTQFTEVDNWQHPLIYNNVYIPSTYYFYFDDKAYLMVNSEITVKTCDIYLKQNSSDGHVINLYTGYKLASTPLLHSLKNTITQFIDDLDGKNIMVACHEMPYTVLGKDYLLGNNSTLMALDRCFLKSGTSISLIGSKLNVFDKSSDYYNDDNYWFSKLLSEKGIKLCIGGHKHTYAITYPVREYDESMDSSIFPKQDGLHISKLFIVKRNGSASSTENQGQAYSFNDGYLYNYDREMDNGVVYFMLQATGYKQTSNKELPSSELPFSKIVPETTWKGSKGTADNSQKYPMYAIFNYDDSVINADLYRISNILDESVNSVGKCSTYALSLNRYGKNKMVSELLLCRNNGDEYNSYKNYWYVKNTDTTNVKDFDKDVLRTYKRGNSFYITIVDGTSLIELEVTNFEENGLHTITI